MKNDINGVTIMNDLRLMAYYGYGYADDAVNTVMIVSCLVGIIMGIICGIVTKKINESKGYSGGFAWGFFLGLIGIIIVAVRSDNHHSYYNDNERREYDRNLSRAAQEAEDERILREGGWKCLKCGRVNASYSPSCQCGQTSFENKNSLKPQSNADNIKEEIQRYKTMLDEGLITQEEFELKKKSILKI